MLFLPWNAHLPHLDLGWFVAVEVKCKDDTNTHTHAHTNTVQAYSQTHILIQTDRHTYTHTHHKIAGCGRILEVLMDAKDFLFLSFFLSFFFFFFQFQLFPAAFSSPLPLILPSFLWPSTIFFFFFYSRVSCWRQLFLLHLHRCSQPSLELLPFLCRSKAQRDGDERAPAVVGADFRAHRWMLLQWACTSEGGWWSLMWLETC